MFDVNKIYFRQIDNWFKISSRFCISLNSLFYLYHTLFLKSSPDVTCTLWFHSPKMSVCSSSSSWGPDHESVSVLLNIIIIILLLPSLCLKKNCSFWSQMSFSPLCSSHRLRVSEVGKSRHHWLVNYLKWKWW